MLSALKKYSLSLAVNLEAGDHLENFLVSSVFSVVGLRVFLALTGYPQLGGVGVHISHMLWGGFLMMLAIVILLSFLSKEAKYISSIIGGLGFGVFIDELGKFVTSDNNYFFRPTVAMIYIVFILFFFGIRAIEKYLKASEKDYTINALETIKEVVLFDLDENERERALAYLLKSNQKDPVVKGLERLLRSAKTVKSDDIYLSTRVKRLLNEKYLDFFIRRKKNARVISAVFISVAIIGLIAIPISNFHPEMSFWDWGLISSSGVTGLLVLMGLRYQKTKGNLFTYNKYKQGVLVTIFLRQFFQFYKQQLSALTGLAINIVFLVALQYLISQEMLLKKKHI